MNGSRKLRERLGQTGPLLVGGAHDGLSALLVSEAGFDAVWASGFEISASHGVPDANILPMSENLRAAARMVEASKVPVIADCDNGYGNAINVIHTVHAYEREGIAAICIEDAVFPKRCSFYTGVRRDLVDPQEHVGKIKACLDTRDDDNFAIIARTEALIAGWGMEEALRRGRSYADAGADMVLVHSKLPHPGEILEFARLWDRDTPLVCVPTTYKSTTATTLADAGYRVIIYANHGIRASIKAMRGAFARILEEKCASAVDDMIAPLAEVYELIGVPTMKQAEQAYLPAGGARAGAIILAAGASPELGELTEDRPKCMLDIKGRSLLSRQVESLNAAGVRDISVVVGWKKEAVNAPDLHVYEVRDGGGEVMSLMQAAPELKGATLVVYGDILFDPDLVVRLLQTDGDVVLVVDRAESNNRKNLDLVRTMNNVDGRQRFLHGNRNDAVTRIGVDLEGGNGEWIGMMLLSEAGAGKLKGVYEKIASENSPQGVCLRQGALTDLLQALIDEGISVRCIETYKGWMEIDTFEDYRRAWAQVK